MRLHDDEKLRREASELLSEALATFLRRPGDEGFPPPAMRDPVTADERITRPMPPLLLSGPTRAEVFDVARLVGGGIVVGILITLAAMAWR
jgi:hypothetical protein